MTRTRRALLTLLALAPLAGCYTHRAVPVEGVSPGARVRATVSPAEAERLAEALGRETPVIDGLFLGAEAGGLVFQVPTATGLDGRPLTQRVLVPAGGVRLLELRELDRRRTGLLVGGATVLGGIVVASQFAAARDRSEGPDRPPVNEIRVPLLRLPLGR